MMKAPSRASIYDGKTRPPPQGAMARRCPICESGPGWSCVKLAFDDDLRPYIIRRLKTVHPERRKPA